MRRSLKICVAILGLSAAGPCAAFGQDARTVRLVEITSRRSVIGQTGFRSRNSHADPTQNIVDLAITKDGDGYTLNGQAVDPSLIAALVTALTAPANASPNLDDLGVTPAWLKERAPSVAKQISEGTIVNGKNVPQDALASIFADPAVMEPIVPTLFGRPPSMCFDCIRYRLDATVRVAFDGGSEISASTSSQSAFMLPWMFSNGPAYNSKISRAVAALMPENAANRALLLTENFDLVLGHSIVWQAITLDAERRTAGASDALREKYTIESANIGRFSDATVNAPANPLPDDSTVRFELRPADLPEAFFHDELILPYVDGNAVGADAFLQHAPQCEQLVESIPWLKQFEEQNKGVVRSKLTFFQGDSFTDEEAQLFAKDMHAIGQDRLIANADDAHGHIAVLILGFRDQDSVWLVFPNFHMILWRYVWMRTYATRNPERFKPADFASKPCLKSPANFMGCVGEEVLPDGGVIEP